MSQTDARVDQSAEPRRPDLITQTEYVDAGVRAGFTVCAGLLGAGVALLAVLSLAGVAPAVVALIVGADLSAAIAFFAFGPSARRRPAVRLGLVDGHVVLGTSRAEGDVVLPLTDLSGVELSPEVASRTDVDPERHTFIVSRDRHVRLTFGSAGSYDVALPHTDPVAAEILRRLRAAVPQQRRRHRQMRPAGTPKDESATQAKYSARAQETASPAADIRLWQAARAIHLRVLSEYGAYELDPALYLRYPGVTDVTREPVMDFLTALEDVQALGTDDYPGDAGFAGQYRRAVDTLRRAWVRCERDGKSTGTSYLEGKDSADLDTAAKLYAHAQASERDEEKATYLRKVHQIVVDLDGRGRVHLPNPVVAAIETQVRQALEAGPAAAPQAEP